MHPDYLFDAGSRLQKAVLIIGVCLLGIGAGPGCPKTLAEQAAPKAKAGGPAIQFYSDTYDFGLVQPGQKIRHTFTFTNPGTKTLQILQVKPSCGCTQIGKWDSHLPPGGTGAISLELDTKGLLDRIRKKVSIKTNIRDEPEKTIWLQGRVEHTIRAVPEAAIFGLLEPGIPVQTRRIVITNHQPDPVRLSILQNYASGFKTRLQTVKPGFQYLLEVTATPGLISGPQTGGVMLQAGKPGSANIWVPICAYVPQAWDVRPKRILLPEGTRLRAAQKTIYVRPWHNPRQKLSGLTSNIPGLTFKLRKEFWRPVYWVTVSIPGNFTPAGSRDGRISLQTDDPDFPKLEIPVAADGPLR